MFQSNKKRTPTTNNGGNKNEKTHYTTKLRKEGKTEGINEGKKKKE